jgi:hypothetical protein
MGRGDHAKHGGGVDGTDLVGSRENLGLQGTYPSTTLRVVPLPTASPQEDQSRSISASAAAGLRTFAPEVKKT